MAAVLPGLVPPGSGEDVVPQELADAVSRAVPADRTAALIEAAATLGAPVGQLLASPMSARVTGWGIQEGLRFVHHELRCAAPLGEEQLPELEVWDEQRPQPRWRDGTLLVPKYFSAFLDAPLPTYDPNHRGKWRTHEMLHRLVGFFWRSDMTRFEAYLGARLGELLPVVHWYGLDEIGRVRCPEHAGLRPGRSLCPDCEALQQPYWQSPESCHLDAAGGHAASALEHFRSEIEACRRELVTGEAHPTLRPGLDASSDAIGYLRGHWNRLTSWSFGAWVERFCRHGVDHFDTNAEFLDHVGRCFERLLAADIEVDTAAGEDRVGRRCLADLGYRALCLVELADVDAVEDAVLPLVDRAADAFSSERLSPTDVGAWITEVTAALRRVVSDEDASATMSIGLYGQEPTPASVTQIQTGLRSALPRSLAGVPDASLGSWAGVFAQSREFWAPEPIGVRFAHFVESCADVPRDVAARVSFEGWLLGTPRVDEEAERFAVLPEDGGSGRVRPNRTMREATFDAAAVRAVLDDFDAHGPVEVIAVHFAGEPRVIECDDDVRRIVQEARHGRCDGSDPTVGVLLDRGFLVFFPPVR
jgi:hypothetical protein